MVEMSHTEPETRAGVAIAEGGIVMLHGSDGMAIGITAEAADGTGRSLITAAEDAPAQLSREKGG